MPPGRTQPATSQRRKNSTGGDWGRNRGAPCSSQKDAVSENRTVPLAIDEPFLLEEKPGWR